MGKKAKKDILIHNTRTKGDTNTVKLYEYNGLLLIILHNVLLNKTIYDLLKHGVVECSLYTANVQNTLRKAHYDKYCHIVHTS